MNVSELSPQEIEYSIGVYTDPGSYAPFNHGPQGLPTLGCIDPRQTNENCMPVNLQAAGGEGSRALEEVLVVAAQAGPSASSLPGSFMEGFRLSRDFRVRYGDGKGNTPSSLYVPQMHTNNCRLLGGVGRVTGEMGTPSQFTTETVTTVVRQHKLKDQGLTEASFQKVSDAAMRMVDAMEADAQQGADAIIAEVQEHSDTSSDLSVVHAEGENRAVLYIINHTVDLGLNRQRVHRDLARPVVAQAYHVTLGATLDLLKRVNAPKEEQALRIAAHVLRAAAVRSVLTDPAHSTKIHFYTVARDGNGNVQIKPDPITSTTKWTL